MGAVFGLFAGFYYWTPKIVGKNINDFLGKIHFWTLFIGVNRLAPILALVKYILMQNKILFDTRKSYSVVYINFLYYKINNYSVNFIYYNLGQLNKFLFNLFTLTNNYFKAQLVEVKNSNERNEIQKASQRLNTKDIQ
jgi:heme/copper-type cytochrome/quinol oxidase subunit 1